jgi:non-specific serine/threonine protein kinase/serine/threonine-protein kinase
MSSVDRQQVKEIFHAAAELAPPDREAFLQTSCAGDAELHREVAGLLSALESAGDFMQQPALVDAGLVATDQSPDSPSTVIGQTIANYQIVSELGRGGMGAVYLATRADRSFDRQVAIKLIKRGMDSDAIIKRFVTERQILADLDHPNIARLIDGGTTENGLPFFVMEYIEGINITRYCDQRELPTTDRLKLFCQVCAAVQYAHQNLVVHRDLKPSNIMVTKEGTPKLLDFGIAKVLSGASSVEVTASIGRVLTPEYASPEELRGLSVTTSSDVFSLGVVLYELLSGHRPFNFESRLPDDAARMITRSQPVKPSVVITQIDTARQTDDAGKHEVTPEAISRSRDGNIDKLRRRLVGDLDNILLKALRKEPDRRYASVQEFSEDIRRHLEGRPVTASPDTLGYRARKFARRHKAGIFAAALVIISMLSATAITTWQARVARRERDKSERRFNQVRKLANSILFEYHDGIAKLPGSTPIREKMVKDALEYLDNLSAESSGDPTLQAELAAAYEKVGNVQGNPYGANLGNQAGALASYRKALAIREALFAVNRTDATAKSDLANDYDLVADILWAQGENDEAILNYRKALALFEELVQSDPKNVRDVGGLDVTLNGIAQVQLQRGDINSALDTYRRALAGAEAVLTTDPTNHDYLSSVAIANLKVGDALTDGHDFDEALPLFERAVEVFSKLAALAENDALAVRLLGLSYSRIALAHTNLRHFDRSLEFNLLAIEQQKHVTLVDPSNVQGQLDIAASYANLGDNYRQWKKFDLAAINAREAIRIYTATLAKDSAYLQAKGNLGVTYLSYAETLVAQGDPNGAVENFNHALDILGQEPVRTAQMQSVAETYVGLGDVARSRASQAKGAARQAEFFTEAQDSYRKAQQVWRELDRQGKIIDDDRRVVNEIQQKLDQCIVALAKLKTVR